VIELKYNDIAFTAIHTRVGFKKSPHELAVVVALPASTNITATVVRLSIALVMRSAVCALTLTAIGYGEKFSDLPRRIRRPRF
jgi:putative exporter of polyketide antibiotics